jgi:hypothetical protein
VKRLWGIRHLRWWWHQHHFWIWWDVCGRYHWLAPHPLDLQFLQGVWDGRW